MSEELFVKLILGIISVIGTIITAYVVPYLKSLATAEQLANLDSYIEKAVRCAEQLYTPEEWQLKKEFVVQSANEFLTTKAGIELTEQQIDTIIEGIVNEVKKCQ